MHGPDCDDGFPIGRAPPRPWPLLQFETPVQASGRAPAVTPYQAVTFCNYTFSNNSHSRMFSDCPGLLVQWYGLTRTAFRRPPAVFSPAVTTDHRRPIVIVTAEATAIVTQHH
jgi:hypothetical protein